MEMAIVKDKIIPYSEVPPELMDRGTFFGDGVYEVLRSYNGKIFALDEHLGRFARSLSEIKIVGVDMEQLRNRLLEAFAKAQMPDAKIYFHITRGTESRSHVPGAGLKASFFLTVTQIHDSPAEKENGIYVCSHADLRWKRCDIKSLNLLPNVLARMAAEEKGCSEAILVNEPGQITEGAGSAFFAVVDNKVITRPLGPEILPSITRGHVIDIAATCGIEVIEEAVTAEQAKQADELFIAVTTRDIVPVVKFDEAQISAGRPGAVTKNLMAGFAEHVRQ